MSDASVGRAVVIDGSGSLVSNVSTFAGKSTDFVSFVDAITDVGGRIRKRPGKGFPRGTSAGAAITTLHEYTFVNSTSGAVVRWRLRTFGTAIQYDNAGVWTSMTLPYVPTSSRWVFVNANNKVLAVNGADDAIIFDGSSTTWRAVGQDGPAAPMTYTLGGAYLTGTVTTTTGNAIIVGVGTTWDFSGAWNGKFIDINGIRYTISTVVDATHITLIENFKETGAAGLSYTIWSGVMDWDLGPKYAWAYYNPTTGHCSNMRSASVTTTTVTQITEQNQVGRTPQLTIPGSAANTAAFNAGYTQIKIFRTPKNANILVAVNAVVNNVATGASIVFTETTATGTDVALTLLEAPLVLNRKPATGLVAIGYWQQRLFAISRTGIYFSAHPSEVALGVAEECWPAKFFIQVNEPNGIFTVGGSGGGDAIVIQTNQGEFSIDGVDSRSFYVYPVQDRPTGILLSHAAPVEGRFVALYGDKRVFEYSGATDFGIPIQDKFDAIGDSLFASSRLHFFAYQSRNFIVVSVPKTGVSSGNDYTYVFDRDLERWYEWNLGFTAFATVHDPSTGRLSLWAGDSAGNVFQLLGASFQDNGSNYQPTFTTSLIRPFGSSNPYTGATAIGSEVRGRLQYLKAYVSDGSQLPTGKLFIEEQNNGSATDGSAVAINFRVSEYDKQSAQGRELIWVPDVTDRVEGNCFQLQITMPALAGDYYFDRIIAVFDTDQDEQVPARA